MRQHQAIPEVAELERMPAGERGPRLLALVAFYRSRLDTAAPRVRTRHLNRIRQAQAVARLVGIVGLEE